MKKLFKDIIPAPRIKLNTLVLTEIVLLLVLSLGGLFYYTRQALVEEAKKDAEQRLECTVQHVDNILKSVEQTTGNFYYELIEHFNEPELIKHYCQKLVVSNSNITGCAIAFKPDFFPDHEEFITYTRRKKYNSPELITSEQVGSTPYTRQFWFTETVKTCKPAWLNPGHNDDSKLEPVITFCLPLRDIDKKCVGVMAVGLSINLLSQIVLETKPTPNSYSILLERDGTYIIHPKRERLTGQTVFQQPEITESPSAIHAAKTMLKGGSGEIDFKTEDFSWYMFYKPFVRNNTPGRSMETLQWRIATIYPIADIFGEYNHLVLHILGITLIGLLVLWIVSRIFIRSILSPLDMLTESSQSIAEGTYTTMIPDTERTDEIGRFQKYFKRMQQSLLTHIKKQEELKAQVEKEHDTLLMTYEQIQKDLQVKTTFLHNVTNRMLTPANEIVNDITSLCDNYQNITLEEAHKKVREINSQSEVIMQLLSKKFDVSYNETGKEANHE